MKDSISDNSYIQPICDKVYTNHLYAYADETAYIAQTSEEYNLIGYGIFITPQKEITWLPNSNSRKCNGIHDYGKYLKCDLNNNFHATDDCFDVRIQIIDAINSNACGIFLFHYVKTKENVTDQIKKRLWDRLLTVLYIEQAQPETSFYIENRNDLTQQVINRIILTIKDAILYTHPNKEPKPFICKPFYKIEVIETDKTSPGITIVDYLTWTCQRKIRNTEKNPSFDKFSWTDIITTDSESLTSSDFKSGCLQRYLGNYGNNRHRSILNYPFMQSSININDYHQCNLLMCYLKIKHIVESIITQKPTSLQHLNSEYEEYLENKRVKNYTNMIKQNCKIFLWTCDTLPIWQDFAITDIPKWKDFLQLKYVALYICKLDHIELIYLCRWLMESGSYNR